MLSVVSVGVCRVAEKTASPSTVSPALQRVDDDEEMGGGRRTEEEEGEMGGGRREEESESEEVDESSGSNEDLEMSLQHIAGRDDSLSADVSKRARRRHKGQRRRGGRRRHKGRWPYDPYLSDAPAGSGVKHKSCKELQCHAGGRCVRAVLGGGVRCQCLLGTTGDFCERGELRLMVSKYRDTTRCRHKTESIKVSTDVFTLFLDIRANSSI